MQIEKSYQTIELCDEITHDDGTVEYVPNGENITIEIIDIYADDGKVFQHKSTGAAVSAHITLGTQDSVENYEEINRHL